MIEQRIEEEYDSYSVHRFSDPFRTRLGASEIGDDCMRKLWYGYRHVKAVQHEGRVLRLFNRGHLEEPRVYEMLEGMGFIIEGKQHAFNQFGGHYGGKMDGVVKFPERYEFPHWCLLSIKTSQTGASFNKYRSDPMQIVQPQYWAQENSYGHGNGIGYALWAIVNKNDDHISFKMQKLDSEYGAQLEQKAWRIISSNEPPEKLSKSPAFKHCSTCKFKDVCHKGEELDRNCRSCKHAVPHPEPDENGNPQWYCTNPKYNAIIPVNVIPLTCGTDWEPITK